MSDSVQIGMSIDLKQFFASLEKMEGVSKETVAKLSAMFGQIPSVQVPFDAKQIKAGFEQIQKGSAPAINGMNRASQSAQTLSYIMRDSPYFFQNFNMGLMAVGNNINPFIDQMLRAKQETGSWKGALVTLGSGLTGIGGISFALSTIVTAFTSYSLWAANSERETRKLKKGVDDTKDSIEELKKAIEGFSTFTLKLKRDSNQAEIDAIDTAARLKIDEITKAGGRLLTMEEARSLVPGSFKYKRLTDENKLYDEQIKKLGYVDSLNFRIQELIKEQNNLKETDLKRSHEITLEVERLQKLITDFQGKTKEKKTKELKFSDELTIMREYIGWTDSMLRAEIKLNQAKLADPNFKGDRVAVLEKIIMLKKTELGLGESYARWIDLANSKGKKEKFDMKPLENLPELNPAEKETSAELERMLDISNSLTESFNSAANAVASIGSESVRAFKNANSLGQIFINTLVQATLKALILKGVMAAFDLVSSFLNPTAPIIPIFPTLGLGYDNGGLFRGRSGIDKNLARLSDGEFIVNAKSTRSFLPLLNLINNTPAFANGGLNSSYSHSYKMPIVVDVNIKGFARGKDIQLALDREANNKLNIR